MSNIRSRGDRSPAPSPSPGRAADAVRASVPACSGLAPYVFDALNPPADARSPTLSGENTVWASSSPSQHRLAIDPVAPAFDVSHEDLPEICPDHVSQPISDLRERMRAERMEAAQTLISLSKHDVRGLSLVAGSSIAFREVDMWKHEFMLPVAPDGDETSGEDEAEAADGDKGMAPSPVLPDTPENTPTTVVDEKVEPEHADADAGMAPASVRAPPDSTLQIEQYNPLETKSKRKRRPTEKAAASAPTAKRAKTGQATKRSEPEEEKSVATAGPRNRGKSGKSVAKP